MSKEYGKLTANQFRRLIAKLPEIRSGYAELQRELVAASTGKVREVLAEGIWWAAFYELPFVQHISLALIAIGFADKFVALSTSEDPQQALLDFVESADDFEPVGVDGKELDLGRVLAAVTSMQRTVFSIMLYQKSLSALVAEARDGDDEALFKAVRVDRSAMTCPSIAVRISKAQVLDDRHFFERLRSALKVSRYVRFGSEAAVGDRLLPADSVEKLVCLARSNTSSKSRPLRMRYKRR